MAGDWIVIGLLVMVLGIIIWRGIVSAQNTALEIDAGRFGSCGSDCKCPGTESVKDCPDEEKDS